MTGRRPADPPAGEQTAPAGEPTATAGRVLELVIDGAAAAAADPGRNVVVLDPFWVPPGGPAGPATLASSVRPAAEAVLARVDVVAASLARLDAWAAAAGLPDCFVVDGHTWWFNVRMAVRWDLQELLLWRHVLGGLAPAGRYAAIVVPGSRPALAEAALAFGRLPGAPRVEVAGAIARPVPRGSREAALLARLPAGVGRAVLRAWAVISTARRRVLPPGPGLERLLRERPRALALAWSGAFQVVEAGEGRRLMDPHIGLVVDRLAADGLPVATVVSGADERARNGAQAAGAVEVPLAEVRSRWSRPADAAAVSDRVAAALRAAPPVPLDADGCDLGPALLERVRVHAGPWLDGQLWSSRWVERFLADVRPGALYLDREATRTPWIAAARRAGVPVVGIQHGMIHPTNPEYIHPPHPGTPRPDVTCVFGVAERAILVERGGFPADRVVVTGSPRAVAAAPDAADERDNAAPDAADERDGVRRELGVRDGDRLLVVSVAHGAMGDLQGALLVEHLLADGLPGVHVVIKLHPQDGAGDRYGALVEGLARSRGSAAPPLTVVRDADLHRLLRAADAHLGQYSTVLTDAVVAGTPTMIAMRHAYADPLGHVAAGVAVPVRTIEEVRSFMAGPRHPAPEARDAFLASHFEPGDAIGRIAAAILAATPAPRPAPGRPSAPGEPAAPPAGGAST